MTLNGPSRIYHLKPVFQLPEHLELNSPMYKMKNLHQQSVAGKITAAADNTSNDQTNSNESKIISDVLKRQEELIKHLQKIQTKVTDLKLELTATANKSPSATDTVDGGGPSKAAKQPLKSKSNNVVLSSPDDSVLNTKNIVVKNVVINLSPHRPAYSLLTLPHIWSQVFKSNTYTMHVHSSASEIPKAFVKSKSSAGLSKENKENSVFNMRLIWKDIPDTELVSSPIRQTPLLGEVSMLRLFHRMFSPQSGSVEELIAVDSALDICHQLLYTTQKQAALSIVKKLAELLGSNEWILGSQTLSIVDAAAWSAILNSTHLVQPKQLGPNLAKWSQKINSLVGLTYEMIPQK